MMEIYCCSALKNELELGHCFQSFSDGSIGLLVYSDDFKERHLVIKHCPFCGISINDRTQREKELIEIRQSMKIVSKPGAVIEMRTMNIPERTQKNISEALRKGKNGEY